MFLQVGNTPLHRAAAPFGDDIIAKTLLDNGCDINAKNNVS